MLYGCISSILENLIWVEDIGVNFVAVCMVLKISLLLRGKGKETKEAKHKY